MSKQVQSNTLQHEKALLNPFEVSNDLILEKVYITHFHGVEKYDVGSLCSVASNVINHSIEISELIIKNGQQIDQLREETGPLISFSRLPVLKRISCQMIFTPRGEQYAHQTTMLILEQLRAYSWDAKAVISLAAFALEFGKLWHLAPTPRDKLGKSLAELNGFQNIMMNIQHIANFNTLVKKVMEVIQCITHWKKLTTEEYNIKEVPALAETLHEIPVLVYWAIITLVTCTGNIDSFGDKGYRYELSKFDYKLDFILKNFKDHLDKCNMQIGAIEDYKRRKDIINAIQTDKECIDIAKFLEALIIPTDSQDSKPVVYNGLTGDQVGVEEFRNKYVLLFISGHENIEYEIQLLKSIDEKLKEDPKELEGYKKDDFKILWIPIVDENQNKGLTENHVTTAWYVVKEFKFKTGIRLIKEVFKYKDKPIILLISPEGKVENSDAKQIISTWGIDGFPFRTSDHTRLTQQWNWFWTEIMNLCPSIRKLIERDCYIFIYGGTNNKWIQDFTEALENLKRLISINLEETTIESYPLGRESPKIVPRFWIAIDNLLASKKVQMMKGNNEEQVLDSATREIQRLLLLKQDPQGWVILSKGSHVKLLGQGEAMYRTVMDFEAWKEPVLQQEVSFDVAFKQYYERIKDNSKDGPHKCEHREFANYPTDILAHIPCPIKCGHDMEVASVNYRCCHGLEAGDNA